MLLEVRGPEPPFLCEVRADWTVEAAHAHVAALHALRRRLAAAAGTTTAEPPPAKRPRPPEADSAAALLAPDGVRRKVVLTRAALEAALEAAGAPSWREAPLPTAPTAADALDSLFFGGRLLDFDRKLSEYVGANEKSKVTVHLRAADGGAGGAENGAASASADGASASASGAPSAADAAISLSAYFRRTAGGAAPAPAAAADEAGADDGEEDEEALLRPEQLERLSANDDVRRALCDARLEALLREIDSCPSRERALRRLEEALADPDFEAFTELVLRAVGYERDGGGEAPARRRARLAAEAAALAAAEEDQLEGDESGEDDGGG